MGTPAHVYTVYGRLVNNLSARADRYTTGSICEVLEIMLKDYIQKVGSPFDGVCLVQLRELLREFPFGYCEGGDGFGGISFFFFFSCALIEQWVPDVTGI